MSGSRRNTGSRLSPRGTSPRRQHTWQWWSTCLAIERGDGCLREGSITETQRPQRIAGQNQQDEHDFGGGSEGGASKTRGHQFAGFGTLVPSGRMRGSSNWCPKHDRRLIENDSGAIATSVSFSSCAHQKKPSGSQSGGGQRASGALVMNSVDMVGPGHTCRQQYF